MKKILFFLLSCTIFFSCEKLGPCCVKVINSSDDTIFVSSTTIFKDKYIQLYSQMFYSKGIDLWAVPPHNEKIFDLTYYDYCGNMKFDSECGFIVDMPDWEHFFSLPYIGTLCVGIAESRSSLNKWRETYDRSHLARVYLFNITNTKSGNSIVNIDY